MFLIIYFYCYLFNLAVLQKKHLDQYQTHVRRGLSRISPEVITITIMTFDFSSCVMLQWLNFFDTKILLFILNLSFLQQLNEDLKASKLQLDEDGALMAVEVGIDTSHCFVFNPFTAKCGQR